MFLSIIIPVVIAFFATYLVLPPFIKLLKHEGLVGIDVHKINKPEVPEMGAPPVLFGFLGGIFAYIGAKTFLLGGINPTELVIFLAVVSTVMIITFIGLIDELTMLIKEREGHGIFEKFKRKGLSKLMQFILPFPAAIPLMAVAAGVSNITIPFLGVVSIGIIYPLILVPIAIVGASNATNMLAGFNGLQAGLGIVMLSFLGFFAYLNGSVIAALIAFIFIGSLIAFLIFNWYPAKIFPGALDYLVGTVIACVAIVGNIEKFALLCFAPWFLELVLKLPSKFKAENYGVIQKDGTLKAPEGRPESLTHVVMKLGRFKEWQVSLIIIGLVALWCGIMFVMNVKLI
jgi:UDP-N-acetylglucosamine--dolichyl-phosphate N-acetylglucosaminephosphotransferase